MKEQRILLVGIFIVFLALISYRVTYAFFSSSASSAGNSFTAASEFVPQSPPQETPTATPSGTLTPSPTPSATPIPSPSPSSSPTPVPGTVTGDVVINEINWAGSSLSSDDEWLELRNMTGTAIDISNWTIDGLGSSSNTVTLPTGKTIPANGFFLISHFNNDSSSSNLNVVPDHVTSSVSLANTGELLTLKTTTSGGIIMDTANQMGIWFFGTQTAPRKSMSRNFIPASGTSNSNWHTSTSSNNFDLGSLELGTPGSAND